MEENQHLFVYEFMILKAVQDMSRLQLLRTGSS